MQAKLPLVSILIPNYNHSKYLDQCIQSALDQTYPNKEIIVLDNSSEDNSVEIASKYSKYGVNVCRNQKNVVNFNFNILANEFGSGKYFVLLCADDYILPEMVEKAVAVMEKYPTVGYVHVDRDYVNDNDEVTDLDPFYKCSFVAPGQDVMPIYMITTVAHPSQGLVRKSAFLTIGGYDMEINHMNADRSMWFYLSYRFDAAYIREKLTRIRIGMETETVKTQTNLQHPILCHLTLNDYVKFAKEKELPAVYNREQEALNRLANEFVGYAGGMLYINNYGRALDYLNYAKILVREIVDTDLYKNYMTMYIDKNVDYEFIKSRNKVNYSHKRSYEPPTNYEKIHMGELLKWIKQEFRY